MIYLLLGVYLVIGAVWGFSSFIYATITGAMKWWMMALVFVANCLFWPITMPVTFLIRWLN